MDAEAARRRQETLEFQARRKREEYARRWKRYGNEEIDVLTWRQQKDGTWVTEVKELELSGDNFKNTVDSMNAALPALSVDKIWVKVRQPISVEELSGRLKLAEERLTKLNDVNEDHQFRQGDWLVVPSQQSRQIKQLAAIDTSELRRTPPLQSLPPVEDRAVVRFGDTVLKIAQRYGLTLQELLRLNPGLETARLVVGSQVRLAQASSGRTPMVLGLKPTTSGGISWPALPGFESKLSNRPPARFDASLDELVRDGVVSADERDRIQGMRRSLIGVNCTSLMVNRKPADERWGTWTRPSKASTDERLVIDRCVTRREAR
ncbi:LysM peptidoglycan-binding domain-containing protein [Cyanobium sp. BA5m-21]|nr:LysM peptidoglycan-binding domain-containing protein [Cyanobium sp. BA5m-10]MCP9908177.1 LysM peptidoglycan-binding domain-containing protein [Cyanobium sp. BA5m-21]